MRRPKHIDTSFGPNWFWALWIFLMIVALGVSSADGQPSLEDVYTIWHVGADGKQQYSPIFTDINDLWAFVLEIDLDDDPVTQIFKDAQGWTIGIMRGSWGHFVRKTIPGPISTSFRAVPEGEPGWMIRYSKNGLEQPLRLGMTKEEAEAFVLEIEEDDTLDLLWHEPFLGVSITAEPTTTQGPDTVFYLIEQ